MYKIELGFIFKNCTQFELDSNPKKVYTYGEVSIPSSWYSSLFKFYMKIHENFNQNFNQNLILIFKARTEASNSSLWAAVQTFPSICHCC
jgi:hypothetical protein